MRPVPALPLAAAALSVVLGLVLAGCGQSGDAAPESPAPGASVSSGTASTADPAAGDPTSAGTGRAGATPAYGAGKAAAVCGSALLDGPAEAPAGAVVVGPGQRLDETVEEHPAGTTYYLTAGVHTLGGGAYSQVQPKTGDAFVGAPGAVLDGRRTNRYAFGGQASGVTIRTLTIQHFGTRLQNRDEGVVNHDAGAGWTLRGVDVRENGGAGVMLGDGAVVEDSCLERNGQYGFNAYRPDGVHDVRLVHNEIAFNNTADWERRVDGCGCTGGGKFWATRDAVVEDNNVHDNHGVGVWADTNNTGFLLTDNTFADNDGPGVMYETSYNARITHNTFTRNAVTVGHDVDFPEPALYLSESGADRRAGATYGDALLVSANLFTDNWSGVVLWENADRFAGSPANSSSGATTLVAPGVATAAACGTAAVVRTKPYVDDCRWKTQHVRVEDNRFVLHPDHIPGCTAAASGCGFVGLFSQWGTYPDWSPFKGAVVEDAVTLHQDNRFTGNSYAGPWRFMVHELGNAVEWDAWRSAPYAQDAGSTLTP